MAKGFTQEEGVHYHEMFTLVVKHTSIKVLISIIAKLDLKIDQIYVNTTFLHGDLDETIYMKKLEDFS